MKKVVIILGVLAGVFVLMLGGCAVLLSAGGKAVSDSIEANQAEQAAADLEAAANTTITECAADQFGMWKATGTVKNTSSGESTFSIRVTFKDAAGTQVGEGYALIDGLDAGGTAQFSAGSLDAKGDGLTCELDSVDRMATARATTTTT